MMGFQVGVIMGHPAHVAGRDWMQDSWRPDPDDIDWDMIDASRLEEDFTRMGGEIPEMWRVALEQNEDGPGW